MSWPSGSVVWFERASVIWNYNTVLRRLMNHGYSNMIWSAFVEKHTPAKQTCLRLIEEVDIPEHRYNASLGFKIRAIVRSEI